MKYLPTLLLLLLLGLLLPGALRAQVAFSSAAVLSQRSATQGASSIEDEAGNLYMAIPFNDTLKLKNPDATYAAPARRGHLTRYYALALLKTNRAGERVGVQLLANSYNVPIGAYWKEAGQGRLKLAVQTTGGISVGAARAANGPVSGLVYSGGFIDLDTNLQVTRIWQTEREARDSTWSFPMYAHLAGPAGGWQYIASGATEDTVHIGRDALNVSNLRIRGLEPNYPYVYLAAVNSLQPTAPLPVKHIIWQPTTSSVVSVTGMASDSAGNVYVSVGFQKIAALMMDDSVLVPAPPINTPLADALCLLKFSPTGQLLWKRPFINNYRVLFETMTPTPRGDKLYIGLEARGELMLGDSLVQTDYTNAGCGGVPGTSFSVVLDDHGDVEHFSMFNNQPTSTAYHAYVHSIVLSPFGDVYWGGVASGFPLMFDQGPVQVWQTIYVICTDRQLGFRWRQLVGGPSDGTLRSIDNMAFNPVRRELMYIGHLDHYVLPSAVGVGSTIISTVCPAQFMVTLNGLVFTETKKAVTPGPLVVFPNPSQSGQTVTVLSNDHSYRLVDALGRALPCTATLDHTLTLPSVAPGFYHLQGDQTGQKIRLVIEQ